MAIYANIVQLTGQTLITSSDRHGSNLSKISIANTSNSHKAIVDVYLDDGTEHFYFIKHGTIDEGTSLILVDCLAFDRNRFDLKIDNTGNSAAVSVIII
jgi:hypothetical protein